MTTVDPSTGQPLPADAIQRVLFIAASVHVYSIPPLASTKGYLAASWTAPGRQIFTARLRILETAILNPNNSEESVKTDVLLEDPSNGELFAAAPYTTSSVVEQVLDSSRFFAIRVVGEEGRKAVLGIGFEERSEAIDFGIALQEVKKVQGIDKEKQPLEKGRSSSAKSALVESLPEKKKDFSLKEGQTIHIDIGKKAGRRREHQGGLTLSQDGDSNPPAQLESLPGNGISMAFLPPPPSTHEMKAEKRRSRQNFVAPITESKSATEMGFDDGEFGEFQ